MSSLPSCPECRSQAEIVKVSEGSFFVMCQDLSHRTRKDNGLVTPYGKILSDGFDAPGKAAENWIEASKRSSELLGLP